MEATATSLGSILKDMRTIEWVGAGDNKVKETGYHSSGMDYG